MSKISDSVTKGISENSNSVTGLKSGLLEIDGITIHSQLTLNELETFFADRITKHIFPDDVNSPTVRIKEPVFFEDMLAKVAIFFRDLKVSTVEIICAEKRFSNPMSSFSHEKYLAKKEFHISWLKEKLGKPTFQNENTTQYDYNWGEISANSNGQDPNLNILVDYYAGKSS